MSVSLIVNGTEHTAEARAGQSLLGHVRGTLGLTGAKIGCGTGDCGACTMLVDGVAVQTCQVSLSSVDGATVQTVEALVKGSTGARIAEALTHAGAAQCGYCLPGIVASATAAFDRDGARVDIAAALAGNLCRCGTHSRILSALAGLRDDMARGT